MGAVSRLFDPLWRAIGNNTLVSCIVLAIATFAAFWLHSPSLGTVLGCVLGTVMMVRAEKDNPAVPAAPVPAE
ncbi:hypothetical protein LPC08_07985 [Roseomonas sp. OT10]|uniref:hypothetical protein n=1 Tax=Roseomonas cutis TaxID=2897332 RepID=UPI001E461787|nr:hypothetical protein [Roseomonas sp. OT10]UFN50543.1 hypothetical protein LPC08_07985 [Roseomonas sp. OT10]